MAIKFTTQPVARNATSRNLDSICAAECKLQDKTVKYVENSQYEILPDEGYDGIAKVNLTVNVPTSGEYSYKKNIADVNGLKAIGWDDESIGMYGDNVLGYEWQRSYYLVSQANKDLAEGFTKDTISSNKSNPDFVYCPMFDTSSITDMGSTFSGCRFLTSIPQLDTANVTNMNSLFKDCSSLQSIPKLITSKVTNMNSMFQYCSVLEFVPQLDTSEVTSMRSMFSECSSLQSIPQLDTSKVTDMRNMFYNCSKLTAIPPLNTSKVTNMNSMFYNCSKLTTIPKLDTSNVTSMSGMFGGCTSLTSIPLLDCSSVTNTNTPFGSSDLSKLTYLGGFKNLKVGWSSNFLDRVPNATVESLMNVINNLYDLTANGLTGKTLKFGTTNLNKLTDEQKAVATNKGWTLS